MVSFNLFGFTNNKRTTSYALSYFGILLPIKILKAPAMI